MTQHINAIFEHGVLRPLVPLDLEERQVVSLSIESLAAKGKTLPTDVPANSMIGLLADDPELADQIIDSAMTARETRPLRTSGE